MVCPYDPGITLARAENEATHTKECENKPDNLHTSGDQSVGTGDCGKFFNCGFLLARAINATNSASNLSALIDRSARRSTLQKLYLILKTNLLKFGASSEDFRNFPLLL